jgi:SAM-dependent methyltransferase
MSAVATSYSKAFYAWQRAGSRRSARAALPIVFDAIRPDAVIDVGCGVGTWLSVARELGARRTTGIEGEWVNALAPTYPGLEIRTADLEQPIRLVDTFDLAICVEVAEHLTPGRAESFVADLCTLAPNVLFSAAVPGQGGNNHLNEQWQSFWADLFAAHDYGPRDIVRPALWGLGAVEYWYRQNAILYSKGAPLARAVGFDGMHPEHSRPLRNLHRRLVRGLRAGSLLRPS